jgi:hypothetical protein
MRYILICAVSLYGLGELILDLVDEADIYLHRPFMACY